MSFRDDYDALVEFINKSTPEEVEEFISFRGISSTFWKVPSKGGGYEKFILRPAQKLVDDEYRKQMDERGYVRLNVLKCRQAGISTYCTRLALWYVTRYEASSAISIAHVRELPAEWIDECKKHLEQTPKPLMPPLLPSKGLRLSFNNGSKYQIGSAQGGFPGMGRTLPFQHKSELGRWDKTGIDEDPDRVLIPLNPAMPTGDYIKNTVDIHESTGVMIGDWWHRTWMDGKTKDNDFVNLFVPWYMVPEYRSEGLADDITELKPYEKQISREAKNIYNMDLTKAQWAWYRHELKQTPYNDNQAEFSAEYPSNEDESFMTAGLAQHTAEMISNARETQRPPIWRGTIIEDMETKDPSRARWKPIQSGDLEIWEMPDKRFHYALGADCMWGKNAEGTDWDVLYVERLEPDVETGRGPLVAKVRGKYPLVHWGWIIAAMGWKYNCCPVAPEVTGQSTQEGKGVLATLLGEVGEYRYPNIWIRSKKTSVRGRMEDYGWDTNATSKSLLLGLSQSGSLDKTLDWCDVGAINQMVTIIRKPNGKLEAPEGMHDDDWMARLITAEVARRLRYVTKLWVPPTPVAAPMRSPEQRWKEMDEEFERENYGDQDEEIAVY